MKSSRPGCPKDHQLEVRAPVFYNLFSNDDLSLFSGRVLDVNGTLCVLYRWIRDKYICLIVSSCHFNREGVAKNIYTRSGRTKLGILDQFETEKIQITRPNRKLRTMFMRDGSQSVSWLSLHSKTAKNVDLIFECEMFMFTLSHCEICNQGWEYRLKIILWYNSCINFRISLKYCYRQHFEDITRYLIMMKYWSILG